MDKKLISILLTIASIGLLISAIIFICLCIFTDEKDTTYLCVSLSNIILSNLFNIIRIQYTKNRKD